jgi:hypothetical protein
VESHCHSQEIRAPRSASGTRVEQHRALRVALDEQGVATFIKNAARELAARSKSGPRRIGQRGAILRIVFITRDLGSHTLA